MTTKNDDAITKALSHGGLVDITTTGRKSGQPHRIEIAYHNIGGKIYISGMPFPNRRSWLANLDANPKFTFHLKRDVKADLPATARVIEAEPERREVLPHIAQIWKRNDLDVMIQQSPLIEVTLDQN